MSKTPNNISVSLRALVDAQGAIVNLAKVPVSGALSFAISLLLQEVRPHIERYHAEQDKIAEKYTHPPVTPESRERKWKDRASKDAFFKEIGALRQVVIDLPGVRKIRRSSLNAELVNLSGDDSAALSWFLIEDVEPAFSEDDA